MERYQRLVGEEVGERLEDLGFAGVVEMAFDFAARFGPQLAHQRMQRAQHVEIVSRLRNLVEHRLEKRPAAILDGRRRVANDEDAERRSGDDDEFIRLNQHFEVAAERRVAAENAADRDQKPNGEIQDTLPSGTAIQMCGAGLTPGCQQRGQPGTRRKQDRRAAPAGR
jgi:hypothetical protein